MFQKALDSYSLPLYSFISNDRLSPTNVSIHSPTHSRHGDRTLFEDQRLQIQTLQKKKDQ